MKPVERPHRAVWPGDLERSVAEEVERRFGRDIDFPGREVEPFDGPKEGVLGVESGWILVCVRPRLEKEGGGVTTACPPERAASAVVNAVPHREEHVVVPFHGERPVERREDGPRIAEVGVRQRLTTDGVEGRHAEEGRADPVAADVEEVDRDMVVVEAVVAEGVAPQVGRGDEPPVGADSGQVSRGGRSERT